MLWACIQRVYSVVEISYVVRGEGLLKFEDHLRTFLIVI